MRALEVRQSLRGVLLSHLPSPQREQLEQELRICIQVREQEVGFSLEPPDGQFVTPYRDTLVVFSGDQIVSALSIEVTPRLENLVVVSGIEFPGVVVDFTINRAEGIIMANRHDSYDIVITEDFDPRWHKRILDSPETLCLYPGDRPVKVYRRYV